MSRIFRIETAVGTALIIALLAGVFVTGCRKKQTEPPKAPAAAQEKKYPDPVPKYPENYKVLLENEHVRVLDFTLRRGATEDFHMHPAAVKSGFRTVMDRILCS